jgi:hypothetical protein
MGNELTTQLQYQPDINIQNREQFLKSLDEAPKKIDKAQGYETVPISTLEATLDEVYMGIWKTDNFRHHVIANEIVGTIDLHVYDPTIKTWITRSGNASVMIRQASGSALTDIGAKIKNGLVMDFPKLSSMCLKAAAKTLGKKFGRDLNRKWEDSYEDIYSQQIEFGGVMDEIKEKLSTATSTAQLVAIWNEYPDLHDNTAAKKFFNRQKISISVKK